MALQQLAPIIIESLRKGIPPHDGVAHYSVGNEGLIDGIKRFHLSGIGDRGIIRFISGHWGTGKTHLFRLLREVAFHEGCLVSSVELNVDAAALNKFERVFYAIISHIATPDSHRLGASADAAPMGLVLKETLGFLGSGSRDGNASVSHEQFQRACTALMADHGIDIDFKKMVQEYWKTFLPESSEPAIIEQTRGEIVQWFSGEGTIGAYRKRFGVGKMVSKDNAKLMLQSLAGFVHLAGYRGLLILFDEAETSYSVMRKSQLKDAHNNLLSLINNIEALKGLFLIYATTPDFYNDPKHGIVIYGALAGRIGKPADTPPRALDTVWNLDAVKHSLQEYQAAARKIRTIYVAAFADAPSVVPAEPAVDKFVAELEAQHPPLSNVQFWRVLVTGVVAHLDNCLQGDVRPTTKVYEDVMDRLREE